MNGIPSPAPRRKLGRRLRTLKNVHTALGGLVRDLDAGRIEPARAEAMTCALVALADVIMCERQRTSSGNEGVPPAPPVAAAAP